MLVILPLQDWLSMFGNLRRENPDDERINLPSNPNHYWRYRMHIKINELIKNKEFTSHIREQIRKSGRI
jgi:4-alpha-glucanotransferase